MTRKLLTDIGHDPVDFARRPFDQVEGMTVGEKQSGDENVTESEEGVGDPTGVERVGVQVWDLQNHGQLLPRVSAGRNLNHHGFAVLKK